MRFRIDLKIFLFLIIFYFTKQFEIYLLMLGFAILHELGHLIMGLILGLKPEKMELMPSGLSISFKIPIKDINKKRKHGNIFIVKEIIIAIAGPITNLAIAVITWIFAKDNYIGNLIIYSNILILVFNLLPIYPLDGGRILKGIFNIYIGKYKSKKLIYHTSIITTIIITAISSISILYYKNIAIFLIIIYIWILVLRESIIFKKMEKIYEQLN